MPSTPADSSREARILRVLQAMPASEARHGKKATRVLAQALGLAQVPSVESVLIGDRGPSDASEAQTLAAWRLICELASPWVTEVPLVIGTGNLGTPDGDPPVDHFYAEVRRSEAGDAFLVAHGRLGERA